MVQNCPKCQKVIEAEDLQCRYCGILFSKWKEREENVSSGNMSRYVTQISNATSSEFNWSIFILACVTIIGVLLYIENR